MTMKVTVLYSFMDDIYDVYGTSEESQLLTDAIQRFGKISYQHTCYALPWLN
ncbi:hypothetical protein MUK42_13427 [Musa troglodytarum]|uniref:Terpene synthase metal-binding domain-containing protein n=2 Tax=Musa troglodytarum TaxID=320322 RepID=A0A9E7GK32_9LILI|nr:hypothetical protein MUK42_13427 [Musa troglodytarum]